MKNTLLALVLCIGCGAVTPDEPVEKTTGAVRYGYSSYVNYHVATNFHCTTPWLTGSNFQFGIAIRVHPLVPAWGWPYSSATYGVEFFADNNESLSMYMTTLPMVEIMDGPYHVLVNEWVTGAGMWPHPISTGTPVTGEWTTYPVSIPAYGLWIYAANERADYPNGVAVLVLDPLNNPVNTTPNSTQGRCASERQFIFSL